MLDKPRAAHPQLKDHQERSGKVTGRLLQGETGKASLRKAGGGERREVGERWDEAR
jgi:hypothetical protein